MLLPRSKRGDIGSHTVCVQMTEAFLDYSLQCGNDLVTPAPEYDFPGLKPGDRWCVCALRWREVAGVRFVARALDGVVLHLRDRLSHAGRIRRIVSSDLRRAWQTALPW